MRGARTALATLLALLPAGCGRERAPPAPVPHARYAVGAPWRSADGAWFYPAERFSGSFTGLAVPEAAAPAGALAADGERRDPAVPQAAVQSLQLPCVLRVTNLANGRQILLRAVDRGPASPGRLVALNGRARELLGIGDAPTPVQVAIDEARSEALAASLGGGPHVAIAAAPLGDVTESSLPPPGGGPAAVPVAATPSRGAAADTGPTPLPPLPQAVTLVPVGPVSLFLDAGRFSGREAAEIVAAATGGTVVVEGEGRQRDFLVRRGPFATVADADAALDAARRGGITGVRIVAE